MARKLRNATPKIVVGDFPYAQLIPAARQRAIESRDTQKKLTRVVVFITAVAVVLSAGAVGFHVYSSLQYQSAKIDYNTAKTQVSKNSSVDNMVKVYDSRKALESQASAANVNWSKVFETFNASLAPGATTKSMIVTSGGTASDTNSISVVLNIESATPISYYELYQSASKLKGVVEGQVVISSIGKSTGGSEEGAAEGTYTYSVGLLLDSSFLDNQDDSKKADTETSATTDSDEAPYTEFNDGQVSIKDLQDLRSDVDSTNTQQETQTNDLGGN